MEKRRFTELGLSPEVLKAVDKMGFEEASPIQTAVIPLLLEGRDVVGQSSTGSGKTAAFGIPMIERIDPQSRVVQALVLCPTRELAVQVAEEMGKLAFFKRGVREVPIYGGQSYDRQFRALESGVQIVIGTPGRVMDHMERGTLKLDGLRMVALDEADRMLDMGFIPDIERICKLVPFTRQTLFFSATMPPEITRLTEAFLHNPVRIEVARAASTAITITQGLVASASGPAKRETLRRLIRGAADFKNAIIFCNRKRDVAILQKSLQKHGFNAGSLHGDMDQRARMASLDAFKSGSVDLIVCSDVAARGLDIPDVSHVFNFDVPTHAEDYVHRIGRTGRAGKTGVALSIVTPADQKYVHEIEALIARKIDWLEGESLANLPVDEHVPRAARGEHGQRPRRAASGTGGQRARAASQRSEDRGAPPPQTPSPSRPRDGDRPAGEGGPKRPGTPRRPQQQDEGPPVVGMGDHVPMFLLRPAIVRPSKAAGSKTDPGKNTPRLG